MEEASDFASVPERRLRRPESGHRINSATRARLRVSRGIGGIDGDEGLVWLCVRGETWERVGY